MDNTEKLKRIIAKLSEKEIKQELIRSKYKEKKKAKKLTTDERLSRIEELLGLEEA